ncbi:unnamed protein product (macronuclear) [Paramecium tetraurelia]|uniref:Protein kinase domain-containing protein n=1 Tax=Paramecium tetraurelia TaxID=5888 RepID=A0CWI9_PARTE|nr:uncharacterized protein GSPATT00001359001 [Paramecium tetraurelia]CAK75156.1 unnamed protein product [Paramecium tetraurelia]|eukprot:XP_001442553.1 hypothetical protein (macronuclear) [Paramecium tetraurelia strain d4-2]
MYQSKVKNYSIMKELGKGANGQVYLAIRDEDNQQYALKLQQSEITKYELEIIKYILLIYLIENQEIMIQKMQQEVMSFMEYYCIAMDYCDQGDLQNFLKVHRNSAKIQEIRDMIFQIAFGIWELHQFNIIHRDLKPLNILMHIQDNELFLKICDLGLSKISKGIDQHTVNIGTPYYMAPELIQNDDDLNYDSSVDIWALGVIIFDFFSEEQLFSGKNINNIFQNIRNSDFTHKLDKIKDKELREICEKCLKRDPKQRVKVEEILDCLNKQKFENYQKILHAESNQIAQSQIRISNTITQNQQDPKYIQSKVQQPSQILEQGSQYHKQQIQLQVSILSKIRDKKFANQLVFMLGEKNEAEILKELKIKGDQLIENSQAQQ